MKKKFINGLLLAGLVVGFTGSMVSCKDYDDEKIGALEGVVADKEKSLQDLIEAQRVDLQNQINSLKSQIDNCKETCAEFRTTVENKFKEYNTLIQNLENKFNDYYTKQETEKRLAEVKQEILDLLNAEAIAKAVADQLNAGNQLLEGALETYFGRSATIKDIKDAIVRIDNTMNDVRALAQSALDLAKQNETNIKALVERMNTAETDINNLKDFDQKLEARVKALEGAVEGINKDITDLKSDVSQLKIDVAKAQGTADEALEKANEAMDKALEAWAKADANYKLIERLQEGYDDLKARMETVEGDITTLKTRISEAEEAIKALAEVVKANKEAADKLHAEMQEEISALAESVSTLTNEVNNVKSKLDAFINIILNKTITGLTLNGTYCPLFGEFAFFNDTRTNMLVAYHGEVDTRGLEFPAFGVDAAMYASNAEAAHLNALTDDDYDMIGSMVKNPLSISAGKTTRLVGNDGQAGNAGTLYFTVNPANVDFSQTKFEIINSKNEVSAITLSDVKKSDHLLNFGLTRADDAQTGNGFYEAKATMAKADIENVSSPSFDFGGIKDVIVDLKNNEDAFDLTRTANVIYNNMHAILPAQALKASWTDEYGDHSFVSQYSIAAAKVKPFAFGVANALDEKVSYSTILGKAEDFLDRIMGKITAGFPNLNPYNLDIVGLELVNLRDTVIHGRETQGAAIMATFQVYIPWNQLKSVGPRTVSLQLDDWVALDQNGKPHTIHPSNPELTLTIKESDSDDPRYKNMWVIEITYDISDEIRHLNNYYTEDWTQGKNITNQIREYLDDIQDFIENILDFNADNLTDRISNSLIGYLKSATKKFPRFMKPSKYMQPVLLVQANGSYSRLSEAKFRPALVKLASDQLVMVPTTYNAEILTPAYKKFVAVTNIYANGKSAKDDSSLKSMLEEANKQAGMCEVYDGGFGKPVVLGNIKTGYTYEIVYSAVDYSGSIVSRKYYFRAI